MVSEDRLALARRPNGKALGYATQGRWVAADTLAVTHGSGIRVFRQAVVHRGIQILYATVE